MLKDGDIVTIRQFCLDRAITILGSDREKVPLERHLEVAGVIEDYLMKERDLKKAQLGED